MLLSLIAASFAGEPNFPYETETASTSLGEMAYWDVGEGDEVVFLVHGLPTSKEIWVDVIPLIEDGRRIIALDLNNFGESEVTASIPAHPERAQAIDELRQALGVDEHVLVAHDLGASVAVDYMDAYGDHVTRLVLLSSPVYPDFEEPGIVKLIRKPIIGVPATVLFPRLNYKVAVKRGLVNDDALTKDQMNAYLRAYPGIRGKKALRENLAWGHPDEMFAEYPTIMQGITAPTLLMQGLHDPYIPFSHARRMDKDIPNSTLIVVFDGSHFLPLDTPGQVGTAIDAFLDE